MPTTFAATLTPRPSHNHVGTSTPNDQYDRACEQSAQAHARWLSDKSPGSFDAWMEAINCAYAWWERLKNEGRPQGLETTADENEDGEHAEAE